MAFDASGPHEKLPLTAPSFVGTAPRPAPTTPVLSRQQFAAVPGSADLVDHAAHARLIRPDEERAQRAREVRVVRAMPAEAAPCALDFVPGAPGCALDAAADSTLRAGGSSGSGPVTVERERACGSGETMPGAVREAGIPARCVTGSHAPHGGAADAPGTAIGSGSPEPVRCEPHDRAELRGDGQRGWDPARGTGIGDRCALLAPGRDHADVPSLRGAYAGHARSRSPVSSEIVRES